MGIKGLPKYISKLELCVKFNNDLKNCRIAIDIGGFMHRYTERMHYSTEYVDRFLAFAREMKLAGIDYVFIFDGMVDKLKSETLQQRRVKREHATRLLDKKIQQCECNEREFFQKLIYLSNQKYQQNNQIAFVLEKLHQIRTIKINLIRRKNPVSRKFFYNLETIFSKNGIPYLVADQEAEKACSWLAQNGFTDFVVSDDFDTLVCGAPIMLRCWKQRSCCTITLVEILQNLRLTYSDFVDACGLAGSDFAKPSSNSGFKKALRFIRLEILKKNDNEDDLLTRTFNRFYRQDYRTLEDQNKALALFRSAKKMFTEPSFPFARSVLIFALVWILIVIKRKCLPFGPLKNAMLNECAH